MEETRQTSIAKVLATALVAVCVLVALLGVSSLIVQPKDNTRTAGMIEPSANGFLGEPANSLDVLFIGDSEMYSAVSPLDLWHDYGFTSYASGSVGQELPYCNTLLHRALECQSPRIVVFNANMFFTPVDAGEVVMRTMQDIFPVFEYHDRWKSLTARDFDFSTEATWRNPTKGFIVRTHVDQGDDKHHMKHDPRKKMLLPLNAMYMHMMFDYCRSHGAEPVIVALPSLANWDYSRHNAIQDIADAQGVAFYDLNLGDTKVDIDWKTETRDRGDHVNYLGAMKVTHSMGELLAADFDLPDHRGDDAFEQWSRDYRNFKERAPREKLPPSE